MALRTGLLIGVGALGGYLLALDPHIVNYFHRQQLTVKAAPTNADAQERCSQQARRSFQEIEARFGTTSMGGDYQSHYNTKLGKCLMLVETMDMVGKQGVTTAYVIDANERRTYATYVWASREGKKYWEVPPTSCELTPRLSEKKLCTSREEFDAFAATYMEQ